MRYILGILAYYAAILFAVIIVMMVVAGCVTTPPTELPICRDYTNEIFKPHHERGDTLISQAVYQDAQSIYLQQAGAGVHDYTLTPMPNTVRALTDQGYEVVGQCVGEKGGMPLTLLHKLVPFEQANNTDAKGGEG